MVEMEVNMGIVSVEDEIVVQENTNNLSSYRVSYSQEYLDCQEGQEDPEGDHDKGELD